MKHNFKSHEIAHAWVHELSDWGKSPGNASFNKDAFYSYSTVIGRRIKNKGGEVAYLINDHIFSSFTSKVKWPMEQAIPESFRKFYVKYPSRGSYLMPEDAIKMMRSEANDLLNEAIEKRKCPAKDRLLAQVVDLRRNAIEFNDWFGGNDFIESDWVFVDQATDPEAIARAYEAKKIERARIRKKRAEREAKSELELGEIRRQWLAGEDVSFYFCQWGNDTLIRLRAYKGKMETTRGASVPLEDAKRTFEFVSRIRHQGNTWRRNGETFAIGDFQLDSINECGVVAGCHHIKWEEIERFASTQGWVIEPVVAVA